MPMKSPQEYARDAILLGAGKSVLDDNGAVLSRVQGAQGNLWLAAVTSNGGFSAAFNGFGPYMAIYGHTSAAVTFTIFYSFDGVNFYSTAQTIVAGGAVDFFKDLVTGAPWIQLQSNAIATVTATASSKAP